MSQAMSRAVQAMKAVKAVVNMTKKQYKKWFYLALCLLCLVFASVAFFNYIIDPYGLFRYGSFRKDVSHQFIEPSKNFIKTRYVSLNPEKFNCFVFGSSRVNGIDVRKIRDFSCYNMHFGGGLPRHHLDNLQYMLKKGVRPKIVLIGLDEFSYKMDPAYHLTHYVNHPYPPVLGQGVLFYYMRYLLHIFGDRAMDPALEGFRGKTPPIDYDHYNTGLHFPPKELDPYIEQHEAEHANKPVFKSPFHVEGDRVRETLEDIKKIVELAKARGIRLIIFINPIHKTTLLDTDLSQFGQFEKALSSITDFWDFSGLNSITTNNYYHYETLHYRSKVGDMMLARMLGYKNVTVPADFGVFVTPENIDRHLENLRAQVR